MNQDGQFSTQRNILAHEADPSLTQEQFFNAFNPAARERDLSKRNLATVLHSLGIDALPEPKKVMLCPECGELAREDIMPEEGVNYPIWVCNADPFHWGSRW